MPTRKERRTKKVPEIIEDMSKNLSSKGIRVSQQALQLILATYFEEKGKALSEGLSVPEKGVGTTLLKYRRSNTFGGTVIPTVKVQYNIDAKLHIKLMYNACDSVVVRDRILGSALTEDEICRLRERCDYKVHKRDTEEDDAQCI